MPDGTILEGEFENNVFKGKPPEVIVEESPRLRKRKNAKSK